MPLTECMPWFSFNSVYEQNVSVQVQDGVQFLRDKHEIAETQLQLAKLGSQRGQRSDIETNYVHQVSLSASVQSYDLRHAVEAQFPGQLPQNQTLPPQPVSYYQPAWQTPDTAFQQYPFPPSTQSESPQLLHFSQPPIPSPMRSLPGVVTSSNHSLLGHHPKEKAYMPSCSYFSSTYQSPSHPAGWGPSKEFAFGSELQMHGQPQSILQSPKVYNFAEMHPNNNLTFFPVSSTTKPFPFSSIPSVVDSGCNYVRLPTAQILPHALPFATSVEAVVDSWGNSNSVPVDDVIEKVTAMGFRRDLVEATVRKLMENGQLVDLNVVLDKVMNP